MSSGRKSQLRWLRDRVEQLCVLSHQRRLATTSSAQHVCLDLTVAAFLFLQVYSAWPDTSVSARFLTGFAILWAKSKHLAIFGRWSTKHKKISQAMSTSFCVHPEDSRMPRQRAPRGSPPRKIAVRGARANFRTENCSTTAWAVGFLCHVFPSGRIPSGGPLMVQRHTGTNSAAAHQRRVRTASLDFIVPLSLCLWETWKASFYELVRRLPRGRYVDDETATVRFVPTRDEVAPIVSVHNPKLESGPTWNVGSAVANLQQTPWARRALNEDVIRFACCPFFR